ncbi:MAG: hypothetical protein M0P58_09765 [Bacteroidales bacterium]|nr:hypothetical protein [Bacteroidales bacterium]
MTRSIRIISELCLIAVLLFAMKPNNLSAGVIMDKDLILATVSNDTPGEKRVQATAGNGGTQVQTAAGNIVVEGSGKALTIRDGEKFIITSGQAIRLLPGTAIEAGGKLVVRISPSRKWSGAQRKAVPEKPADQITRTSKKSIEVVGGYRVCPLPESAVINMGNRGLICVVPARVQVSTVYKNFIILHKSFNPSLSEFYLSSLIPVKVLIGSRWGELPGTIRVMRT